MAQNHKNNDNYNLSCNQKQFSKEDIFSQIKLTGFKANPTHTKPDVEKEIQIAKHFKEIMQILGLDLTDSSLAKTPQRVAKMYVREIFRGLNLDHFPKISVMDNTMKYDQMIIIKNVKIMTFCEHHFITICGKANIAYIPKKYIIGLSKINRIAHFFSQRPQMQEQLTKQITDVLCYVLETNHVAVSINAKHFCVIARGIEDTESIAYTCDLRGDFKNDVKTRMEFMQHCQNKDKDI